MPNDNQKVKYWLYQIEISKRVLVYLWNTGQPTERFQKPIERAAKCFETLRDLVVFETEDIKKFEELSAFFIHLRDRLDNGRLTQ